MRAFIDTNVLLYAVGTVPHEDQKRSIARNLIIEPDRVISLQILNEFVWQSSRPHKGPNLPMAEALAYAERWKSFDIQDLTATIFDAAVHLLNRDKFAWWDCLIIAAARAQGCDILYTEDMQDGRIIDGLRIVNPFRDL